MVVVIDYGGAAEGCERLLPKILGKTSSHVYGEFLSISARQARSMA